MLQVDIHDDFTEKKKPPPDCRGGESWPCCGWWWLGFGRELITRAGAIFPCGLFGGLAPPPQHARRHGKTGAAAAFAADLFTVGSQHRRPLVGTIATGAGNGRKRLAGGFALVNVRLIDPPLVAWADLWEVADAV